MSSPGWRLMRSRHTSSGQRRVEGIGAHLALPEARHGPLDARGQQVDLAHLGRVAIAHEHRRVVRRQPGGAGRPGGRVGGRPARPGAERQLDRGARRRLLPARGELEASGEHRVHDDAVAIEHDVEELAQAPDLRDGLAGERLELGRRAADGQRHLRPRGGDRPVRQGGVEGVGDDVEVRQLGHGPRLYPPIPRARLSRPTGARTVEELCPVPSARRSGPPAKVTNDPSPSKDGPGRGSAAVRDSGGEFHEGDRITLTDEQQGGTAPAPEATASGDAPATEQTVAAIAVADEPAAPETSPEPELITESEAAEAAVAVEDEAAQRRPPPTAPRRSGGQPPRSPRAHRRLSPRSPRPRPRSLSPLPRRPRSRSRPRPT